MTAPVTSIYAGLLAFLFLFLSLRVIAARRAARVAIGVGGDPQLERVARVHSNFAEYVPLALLLMILAESAKCPPWAMHVGGVVLVGGRLLHAWGVSQQAEDFRFRGAGMRMTFAVLAALGAFVLAKGISGAFL